MLESKLPVGEFIPIIIGKGPLPEGTFKFEVNVADCPLSETTTFRTPPLYVASTLAVSGFVPISYFSISAFISALRHFHSSKDLIFPLPSDHSNGFGNLSTFLRLLGSGNGGFLHSFPVFSSVYTKGTWA